MSHEKLTSVPQPAGYDGLPVYKTESGEHVVPKNIPVGESGELYLGIDSSYNTLRVENVDGVLMIGGKPIDENATHLDPQGGKHKLVINRHPASSTVTIWTEKV